MTRPAFVVRDARPEDAERLAADARLDDVEEWFAASGNTEFGRLLRDLIISSRQRGERCRTAALPGRGGPLAIWGVTSVQAGNRGTAWLVATNQAAKSFATSLHAAFLQAEIAALDQRFGILECWADERNKLHHKWLTWLGFQHYADTTLGPQKFPFRHYIRTAPRLGPVRWHQLSKE